MTEFNLPTFFAGVLSSDGYCSHLDNIYNAHDGWRAYLIKGGAGMGKSTFMKKLAAYEESKGGNVELITCPSDPNSLDAAIFTDLKVCIMDATSPHVVNPQYPEICEVILNLADHCDRQQLEPERDKIFALNKRMNTLYRRASRYISAISSLLSDTYRIAYDLADTRRAAAFGTTLAQRLMPKREGKGTEQIRFLSAVTPYGLIHHSRTVGMMCDNVIAIEDEYGAVSRIILSAIKMTAVELGYNIITCMCPFAPDAKPEHVIVPELRLAFVTQNRWLKTPVTQRIIHARRFSDVAELHQRRQHLSFNRRAVTELIAGTVETLAQAKSVHDELEAAYIGCMDFGAVEQRLEQVKSELDKRRGKNFIV